VAISCDTISVRSTLLELSVHNEMLSVLVCTLGNELCELKIYPYVLNDNEEGKLKLSLFKLYWCIWF